MSKSPGLGLGQSPGSGLPGFEGLKVPRSGSMQEWINTTTARAIEDRVYPQHARGGRGEGPQGLGLSREDQVSFRHFLSYV